jgi:iron complex outermembrane receptor protein
MSSTYTRRSAIRALAGMTVLSFGLSFLSGVPATAGTRRLAEEYAPRVPFQPSASLEARAAVSGHPPGQAPAAITVSGTVRDGAGHPLPGVAIELAAARAISDSAGWWSLTVAEGPHDLLVRLDGFEPVQRVLDVSAALGSVDVILTPPIRLREDVVVVAVRAADRDPVSKTDIDATWIAEVNRGQEMPFLLSRVPSVNVQSDSGLAAGYAYFNIRGIGQTRLNVTMDGIPLQDPEDQALYFSNFGDFASVVGSVQVQRGVGTSSVGSASYGGSVNFATVNPAESFGVDVQAGGGSWSTGRATAAVHSGRFDNGLALYGRVSTQTTDGFREHSGARQRTLYYGATWQGANALFKVFGLSGRTRTQLAYLAADEATLNGNLRANALTTDERDRFGQDVVQAQYSRLVGSKTTIMAQAYYNGAQGWFRIWDAPREVLQQYGINGQMMGIVLGATTEHGRLGLNWGAHANDFSRDHFMDIVGGHRAYTNAGDKNEANTFLKATWNTGRSVVWGDGQVRHARFRYHGDLALGSVDWTFFNPKAGFRFDPTSSVGLYASAGRMSREPARSDMMAGEDNPTLPYDLHAVKPERVIDVEAGIEVRGKGLTAKAGAYAMEFRDEIALTGELSDIGLPLRRNVGQSARRGVELEASWRPSTLWRLAGSASFSRNRYREWTQFYDVYDAAGAWADSVPRGHWNVAPLLTPAAIVNGEVGWSPSHQIGVDLAGRWVDAAQLDNTGHAGFRTPSFFSLDAQATVKLSEVVRRGDPRVRVAVTNLLNERRAWPGGYSYLYLNREAAGRDTLEGTAYYYPLAARSVYVTFDVRF